MPDLFTVEIRSRNTDVVLQRLAKPRSRAAAEEVANVIESELSEDLLTVRVVPFSRPSNGNPGSGNCGMNGDTTGAGYRSRAR